MSLCCRWFGFVALGYDAVFIIVGVDVDLWLLCLAYGLLVTCDWFGLGVRVWFWCLLFNSVVRDAITHLFVSLFGLLLVLLLLWFILFVLLCGFVVFFVFTDLFYLFVLGFCWLVLRATYLGLFSLDLRGCYLIVRFAVC